ncbi:DUF6930 domain-containing protein [Bacteroidota bacterium]
MNKDDFLWHRMYSLAKDIYNLAPWNWLYEDDIFGVKMPYSGQIHFISVMGSAGDFTAISAYKGSRALQQFSELYEKEDRRQMSESVLTIPHIMLSFEDRNLLRPEHHEQIKASGLKFRGAGSWPVLDEIIPGYVPAKPAGNSLSEAVLIYEQVLDVAKRAEKNAEFILPESYDDDVFLIREKTTKNPDSAWTDRYRTILMETVMYRVKFPEEMLPALNALPRKPNTLQLDLALIPAPVKDNVSPGYFPFLLLLCNKKSGMVEAMQTLPPKPDLDSMYESLPQQVMELLMKINYTPRKMEIRSEILLLLMPDLLGKAGIEIVKSNVLESVDEAVDNLMDSL